MCNCKLFQNKTEQVKNSNPSAYYVIYNLYDFRKWEHFQILNLIEFI